MKCSVLDCRDRARTVFAVADPEGLAPCCRWETVYLCGTHAIRGWPWPHQPVRQWCGYFNR